MDSQNICRFGIYESSDLVCTSFVYETTNCQSTPKASRDYLLHLVADGTGSFVCRGRRYALSRGTVFCCRRGEIFAIESDGDLEYCYIAFHGRRAEELLQRVGAFDPDPICPSPDVDAMLGFWRDCLGRVRNDTVDLLGESALLYTFACLQQTRGASDSLQARIIAVTEQKFTDPKFSLAEVARELGYVPKYLSAYFKKHSGIAFTQYLRDLRMKRAIFLIEQGINSVKNIAILSGFSDALYFSTVFKQTVGETPRDYIRRRESLSGEEE